MTTYWLIAIAGGLGAVARFAAVRAVVGMLGNGFPYGTLLVNVVGSFLMGFLSWLLLHKWAIDESIRYAVLVGLLGGFTTFSSFSLEALQLIEQQAWLKALFYMSSSVIACVFMCFLGLFLAKQLS
ncbi:MAG: fluoride efflux transporter CrcB [Arenicella sp.]